MWSQLASHLVRRAKLIVAAGIVLILIAGNVAAGVTPATVFACVNTNTGAVRIVAAEATCRNNEHGVTLSPDLTGAVALLQQQVAQLRQQVNGILNPPQPVGGTPGASAMVGAPGSPTVSASNFGSFELFVDAHDFGPAGTGDAGSIALLVFGGGGPRVCSAQGPSPDAPSLGSLMPLDSVRCGTSFGQSVSIVGCTLDATVHAFAHQDHPQASYLGMTTVDVHLQQTAGTHDGAATITIYSPKSRTVFHGSGPQVDISTCH